MSPQSVPFIDLLRREDGFLEQVQTRVSQALKEAHYAFGPEVQSCHKALLQASKSQSLALCANGTDAIQLALRAYEIGAGDKVLIPDMTFWATFEAVVNVGAQPLPIDVNWNTLHLDQNTIEMAIKKFSPKALILVHLYGWAAPETESIRKLCFEKGIILIEDSAQAFGTLLNGRSLIGEAACATTSFYPAKVLGASGDAGAVFAKDPAISELISKLANHGRMDHYEHGWVGWNSRIGVYESIFLEESVKYIETRLKSRREVLDYYSRELKGLPLEVMRPTQLAGQQILENGYLSVCRIDETLRPRFIEFLKEKKIGYGTVYPGAMSRQRGTKGFMKESMTDGTADRISKTMINLPCFAYMTSEELNYVVDSVREFFKKHV